MNAITTWLYDDPTGLLTNKLYADGNGPAYTYNRLGQQLSATTSVSTNIFVYSPVTLELDYELQSGAKTDRSTDDLGRNTGYALYNPVDLVNPVQKIAYEFDAYGRFSSVLSVLLLFNFLFFMYVFDLSQRHRVFFFCPESPRILRFKFFLHVVESLITKNFKRRVLC
ncbi:MAG: hypothetical protein PHO37_09930 [Kiritimatiellae bacterium]|nr:hypothetical protein [Kiritimatiellia bacterium]